MVNLNCQQNIELFKGQISGYICEGIPRLVYLRLGDVPYVNSSAPWADVLGGLLSLYLLTCELNGNSELTFLLPCLTCHGVLSFQTGSLKKSFFP